ncbi:MAG: lycopene cyclase family protein [Balneolaceae bacterium]|nr:lycopene cyclase family protein [Balneolaceae bacterium]
MVERTSSTDSYSIAFSNTSIQEIVADQNQFDIIIAGAGAAGLSLLWRILESPKLREQKLLLIDKDLKPANDKTWCFWEDLELPGSDLIYHSWNHLQVRIKNQTFQESLKNYTYHCLRSIDFANSVLRKAKEHLNATTLEAEIHDFSYENDQGIVHTSKGDFISGHVFQSVKKPLDFSNLKVDISLIQHFLGWEIETSRKCFNPEKAIFMDFEVPQKNGITFMYLLPFSEKNALVEYTIFSEKIIQKELYEQEIYSYLEENYGLQSDQFSIKREEFGAIPMDDRKYPAWYCKNVLNIGTVAGLPKPTTGYTFSRIQKHSEKIINSLEKGIKLPESQASSYRFRVYDLMMLYLMKFETDNALKAFNNLFEKNEFDMVLRFLGEETNFAQELSIFSKMPYRAFIRSIYQMKHRIFTGA